MELRRRLISMMKPWNYRRLQKIKILEMVGVWISETHNSFSSHKFFFPTAIHSYLKMVHTVGGRVG